MRKLGIFVVVGLSAALAGCAAQPESIAVATQEGGLPAEAMVAVQSASSQQPAFETPTVGWLDAGEKIAVTLVSDEDCPATPTSLELLDSDRLGLEILGTGGANCGTGERGLTTHTLNTPRGVDYAGSVTLEYMGTEVVLPPIFNDGAGSR